MYVVVDESGLVTLPREVLEAASVEPGDLLEFWSNGFADINVKVVLRIPASGEEQGPVGTPWLLDASADVDAENDPDDRPVVTLREMLVRRRLAPAVG